MKSLAFLSVMSILMFASCSKEDDVAPAVPEDGSLTFELSAVNELNDGTVTRTPVYSQEATQHVTNVQVYAFKKTGADYLYSATFTIPWVLNSSFQRYAVPKENNLPMGDYKFLGVGYGDDNKFNITAPTSSTKFEDMMGWVTTTGDETELFSGSTAYTIASQGSRVNLQMMRKVAGVMGYFKNVPTTIDGKEVRYLRLSVSTTNRQVNLGSGVGSSTGAAPFNLINIDLSGQSTAYDVYTGNPQASGVVKVANSQLDGKYMVPVLGVSMILGLYDANGVALRTWQVVSPGTGSSFDIMPNYFYTLGKKLAKGTTTGNDPDSPNDDDSPIDLLTDQTITITISPNWTNITDLVLQDPVN